MKSVSLSAEAPTSSPVRDLGEALHGAQRLLLSQQFPEGFWWYTLEANESIGAGLIQLMHWSGHVEGSLQTGLARRIESQQRENGSWALFFEGPSDLSTTVECYFSLKLAGYDINSQVLLKARQFILSQGGLEKVRVFTRIHLALFGLVFSGLQLPFYVDLRTLLQVLTSYFCQATIEN